MSIELKDVHVSMAGVSVLHSVSFSAVLGRTTVLAGPSGGGKSTVLRCICGLVPPTSGTVRIDNEPLTARTVWRLRTRLAYVPQESELGPWTARAWLDRALGFRANRGVDGGAARIQELLDRFRLDHGLLDQRTAELSGGEKQRIALVGAALLERPNLLLDEPTSALDRDARADVARFVGALDGTTVLAVLHEPDHFPFADRIVQLRGGRTDGRD